jgi:hypothetical protein
MAWSHDRRFKAENVCGRSDLFHVNMTWKGLGLNRHKTNLCQLVYIAFHSAAIAQGPPCGFPDHRHSGPPFYPLLNLF